MPNVEIRKTLLRMRKNGCKKLNKRKGDIKNKQFM